MANHILKILFFIIILTSMAFIPSAQAIKGLDQKIDSKIFKNSKTFGDYHQMIERRTIRALVPQSKTFYFLDGARPRGASYEALKQFEKILNKQLSTKILKINVIIIPTSRDRLIPALKNGFGDIAVGNLTVTKERLKHVDFSDPMYTGVNEILVTHSGPFKFNSLEDLSGSEIHVRESSSYFDSLEKVNKQFAKKRITPINIVKANEYLEDEDLLEMMNAGLIPAVIIDSHKGKLWAKIFKNIQLHPHIKIRKNSQIAWAIRKNSPEFKKIINKFIKDHKKGTLFGNIVINRYLKNTRFINHHYKGEDRKRFESATAFFKKYAHQYDFDWLMLAALAYQESRINQDIVSHAGAVGVMQVLPNTAKNKPISISDISNLENNIHAGTKYLRYIIDRYFNDPDIDKLNKVLLAFASYNAGPTRIMKLRKKTKKSGLDPNIWFKNVEILAAKKIGRETVDYVSNIFKYYIAYHYIVRGKTSIEINSAKKIKPPKRS